MTDLIPELALIVSEQPPVPELPPQDAQRRLKLAKGVALDIPPPPLGRA